MSTFTTEEEITTSNSPAKRLAVNKVDIPSPSSSPSTEPQQPQPIQPQQIATGSEATTAWGVYLNSLNAQYQEKIRRMAQQSNYTLNMRYEDGREEKQVFTRMKLLQWQFDEIEDLRAEATELATTSPRQAQKALSNMYAKASGYILFNPKRGKPMTEQEYKHCEFPDIRPAIDASLLLSLVSDPN